MNKKEAEDGQFKKHSNEWTGKDNLLSVRLIFQRATFKW